MSKYYDTERVVITCACGLNYLAGSGENDDPLLSSAYDPIKGGLDHCKVCEKLSPQGIYRHAGNGNLYMVIEVLPNKTDDTEMVLYTTIGSVIPMRFVRTVDNFKERFYRVRP